MPFILPLRCFPIVAFEFDKVQPVILLTLALSLPFKEDCWALSLTMSLSPWYIQWCDVLGFAPTGSVSSSSTLQTFQDVSHLWWLPCPTVYLISHFPWLTSQGQCIHRSLWRWMLNIVTCQSRLPVLLFCFSVSSHLSMLTYWRSVGHWKADHGHCCRIKMIIVLQFSQIWNIAFFNIKHKQQRFFWPPGASKFSGWRRNYFHYILGDA